MKATSAGYLALQKIYLIKAREDLAAVRAELTAVLKPFGLTESDIANPGELELFVKHSAYLKVIRGHNLCADPPVLPRLAKYLNEEDSLMPIFHCPIGI